MERMSRLRFVDMMNANLRGVLETKLTEPMEHGISLSNGANMSQSELSEMHCISYGAYEHETRTDLCFKAKKT